MSTSSKPRQHLLSLSINKATKEEKNNRKRMWYLRTWHIVALKHPIESHIL